mmetsp:Transcript_48779/g.66400  ORF Transcript_48779/g.66400 Transcript_48779/m.66400 type:complete len:109 (-) Transcript_48779:427-753(-)|eukprot:CAMPEP_0176340526 /NCGR_PEP_ID=MMETSP0126-20121128/1632_1 /TAXON_ID=141414 ORGANISM="Strombidinopsis acuminatum, Strain SPMC142" /NCGR_SAMPLE_ID=MMETSP0126 /ASSEMBLY_ACC=CAM_ASM_000229 /LENGTH=108 /DNA_ID=CAMNT_0017684763 /DNA_START=788 /DNA_END=1114 /DNA_ORIENTATION=-
MSKNKIRNLENKGVFLQELYALSALSVGIECPYIVRYHSSWIEDNILYIVMEMCKNTLRSYAQKKRHQSLQGITESQVVKVMRDVCMGLKELHSRDIVHLDIKPENIL